jgi:hypothetical protein
MTRAARARTVGVGVGTVVGTALKGGTRGRVMGAASGTSAFLVVVVVGACVLRVPGGDQRGQEVREGRAPVK